MILLVTVWKEVGSDGVSQLVEYLNCNGVVACLALPKNEVTLLEDWHDKAKTGDVIRLKHHGENQSALAIRADRDPTLHAILQQTRTETFVELVGGVPVGKSARSTASRQKKKQ